jgi:hypothetical protein
MNYLLWKKERKIKPTEYEHKNTHRATTVTSHPRRNFLHFVWDHHASQIYVWTEGTELHCWRDARGTIHRLLFVVGSRLSEKQDQFQRIILAPAFIDRTFYDFLDRTKNIENKELIRLCNICYLCTRYIRASLPQIKTMKKNMGSADRIIRLVLAAVMAGLFLGHAVTGTFGIILLALAAIFLLTSLINFCPLYVPLGINTCKK